MISFHFLDKKVINSSAGIANYHFRYNLLLSFAYLPEKDEICVAFKRNFTNTFKTIKRND